MVRLESEPAGADVYFNGQHLGKTPFSRVFWAFEDAGSVAEVVLPSYQRSDCPGLEKGNPTNGCVVTTAPPNAAIHWNGQSLGVAPAILPRAFPRTMRAVWPEVASALPSKATDQTPPSYSGCDLSSLRRGRQAPSVSLAVLDFDVAGGVQRASGRALSDLCRSTVQEADVCILLDRDDILAVLGEEDFASAIECDDTRCLVDYGRKLRAQKILFGRLDRIGSSLVLTLKITDVSTASIDALTTELAVNVDHLPDIVQTETCRVLRKVFAR